ncbi:MAG TPA: NTP transferase domain-containing protein, partial [Firmicutes bacterium]|nr:NTP transferase domain-containing protein [Bacillota bacterium]
MDTAIIVQARMGSTRLPGKIMKKVLGKPLLEYQLERLLRVKLADKVIIATTDNGEEQPIIDLCQRLGVPYFRGPEQDVLARYYGAATQYGADVVVRITSDCPLIDPAVVDKVIGFYLAHQAEYD